MDIDHSKQLFYEAFEDRNGRTRWKIYRYDKTGNREEIIAQSPGGFPDADAALDAAAQYMEDNGIEAELA